MTHPLLPVSFKPSNSKAVVGVCPATIYKLVNEGKLRLYKHGTASLILSEDWIKYVRSLGDQLGD
ncbi:MAG: helix-turn-helix domain-containing protein [Silicimonas sp.]|nr:helix-turn-helix domain-containing protein [Silicimonas sp.]